MRFLVLVLAVWAGGRVVALYRPDGPANDGTIATIRARSAAWAADTLQPAGRSDGVEMASAAAQGPVYQSRGARITVPLPPAIDAPITFAVHPPFFAAIPPRPREGAGRSPDSSLAPTRQQERQQAVAAMAPERPDAGATTALSGASARRPAPARTALAPAPSRAGAATRGSLWLFWRQPGSAPALATQGQLGGSQAGLVVEHRLAGARGTTISAYVRATSALARPHGAELAPGLMLRTTAPFPLSIGVERRIALDRAGRDDFALVATGGIGPRPLVGSINVEAYGQAGIVGTRRPDPFIDGRVALTRQVGHGPFAVGIALAGGHQPGLSRLDVGPVVSLTLPSTPVNARLTVEWRERIAGHAAPGSGATLTLGADF